MTTRRISRFLAALAASGLGAAAAAQPLMTFDEIMGSISAAGAVPNGAGDVWTFNHSAEDWMITASEGEKAVVVFAGPDAVFVAGFPPAWSANGIYRLSRDGASCALAAERSPHRLEWSC